LAPVKRGLAILGWNNEEGNSRAPRFIDICKRKDEFKEGTYSKETQERESSTDGLYQSKKKTIPFNLRQEIKG